MALVLVEKEYDNTSDNYHGFSEPELSIAIKQIKQLRAINVRLLDILKENNLISKEQKEAIETELTKEELKRRVIYIIRSMILMNGGRGENK